VASIDLESSESVAGALQARGVRADRAKLYADTFVEYRKAVANIQEHGAIVQHPRTGNPINNPYVSIRDSALRNLQKFRGFDPSFLWESPE